MINTEKQRQIIASGLRAYVQCPVIRGNQTAKLPEYPFVSYNITQLANVNKGTYGEWNDGKARKPFTQTWSITAYSDDYSEAVALIEKVRDWLEYVGSVYLNENDIIVQSLGNINDRSNILDVEYQYSYGFDCFFWLYNELDGAFAESGEYIESADINGNAVKVEEEEDDLFKRLEKRLDGDL